MGLGGWVELSFSKPLGMGGVGVISGGLGFPAGKEGVKCLCTSAGLQVSLVQVPPGRGGARLAPGPLGSLRLVGLRKPGVRAEKETLTGHPPLTVLESTAMALSPPLGHGFPSEPLNHPLGALKERDVAGRAVCPAPTDGASRWDLMPASKGGAAGRVTRGVSTVE